MNKKLLCLITASMLILTVLTACSQPTSATPPPEESNLDLQQVELIFEANTIKTLFNKYSSVKQTLFFYSGTLDNGVRTDEFAKLPDGTWATFTKEPDGTLKATYHDAHYLQGKNGIHKFAFINDGLFENTYSTYNTVLFDQFPDSDVISVNKTDDVITIVSEFPPKYYYKDQVGVTDGKIRCETVADARTLELVTTKEYHIANDGSERLIVEITYEYDYPFAEPEYAKEWRELDKNPAETHVLHLIVDPGTPSEEQYTYVAPIDFRFLTAFNEPVEMYEDAECTRVFTGFPGEPPAEITLYVQKNP